MNDNRTLRQKFGECLASRGPYYRKLCVMIAGRVAKLPNYPIGIHDATERDAFKSGYEAGCAAVADVIRSIDDPSVELRGQLALWNKAGLA